MTKQELTRDMKSTFGSSFLNVGQVAEYRGTHLNTATKFLRGVDYTKQGNGRMKRYFVGDIADRILQDRILG